VSGRVPALASKPAGIDQTSLNWGKPCDGVRKEKEKPTIPKRYSLSVLLDHVKGMSGWNRSSCKSIISKQVQADLTLENGAYCLVHSGSETEAFDLGATDCFHDNRALNYLVRNGHR